ncbi:MAG: uncharacterized protein QOG86_2151 [Thermoleophilaceae bacterium]|nr:uncharacterized protein [Thermoleophilaceae bacterium]MEA2351210.1 uncharacterized protein [Thermoleophilaceae bacterium]MEA2351671.1 uncharacterized protein [Thermoleophilaceae bacterium]MEA2369596.1 uncharacterized protein [Thermoleophilaceae bacterium]
MIHGLLDRPPWLVLGALLGLVVLAAFALLNERVGVVGGFADVVERVTGRRAALGWKAWFVFGVVGGGLAFRLLAGEATVRHGYGWLTRELAGPAVALVLVGAGVAIGYGAKKAGGCTSGNGLGGCASGSAASLTATGTFMATAIAVSFAIEALT